jgi:O-antigen/teichoic acid export membrane protein
LGANGLGICNFIISYGQNYIIIAALGMPVYATREIAKVGNDKAKLSKLFFELLTIHLCFTMFLMIIYVASIYTYAEFKDYKDLAFWGASLILFNVFNIEWLFTAVNNFKYITIRSLLIRALSIVATILLVKKKDDFSIYFIIQACTVLATVLMDVHYARNFITTKVAYTLKGILPHVKSIFILGIYMVLTSIYSVLPTTLLGFLSTKSAVGYYYGANRIIRMVISIFTSLIKVLFPRLNLVLETQGEAEYLALVDKSLNIVVSVGIPITFLVFLLAHPLVMLLAGKNFTNSILVIQIMSPIIIIVAFAQVFVLLILSVNRKDKNMVMLSVTGMAVSLMINVIFIPAFAEKATAFSQLMAELMVTLVAYFLSKKVLDFRFPTRKVLLNVLFVLPFSLFTYLCLTYLHNNFLIIIVASLCCGAYYIFYQLFLIKDKLIAGIVQPYFFNIRNKVLAKRNTSAF